MKMYTTTFVIYLHYYLHSLYYHSSFPVALKLMSALRKKLGEFAKNLKERLK